MKTIQLTLDDTLHSRAKTLAFSTGATFGDLIRSAVADHVLRLETENATALKPTAKTQKGRRP